MLTDGRDIPADSVVVVDLCIIGAGPAGLAVARELRDSKLNILMLERGDVAGPPAADLVSDLELESPHFRFRPGTQSNQFGGMATTWKPFQLDLSPSARYLPLDPIDFEARYWVPNSGWPVDFDHMAPYYERARTFCGIDSFDFHAPLPETDRPPLSSPTGALVTRLEQFGLAATFTSRPHDELLNSDHVHVVTNAGAVELTSAEGSDDGLATTTVRTPGGGAFSVRSRVVVLAGGAIENARLLLNSTTQYPTGLGNQYDNVGRYFMEHPRVLLGHGSRLRPRVLQLYERHMWRGQLVEGRIKLSEATLRREELLNGGVYFIANPLLTSEQVRAWRAARVAVNMIKRRKYDNVRSYLASARPEAPALAWFYLRRRLSRSAEPVLESDDAEAPDLSPEAHDGLGARSFDLVYQPEQAPNRVNRVTLSERRDAFGYPIAHLYWRWSEIDLLSIRRVGEIVAAELRANGLAETVEEEDGIIPKGQLWPRLPSTSHHLLGTTRMHDDPRHGVVDHTCRVHGSSSVYVAGASVFTTAGFANPTLTVVALAVRLADELRHVLHQRVLAPPQAQPTRQ